MIATSNGPVFAGAVWPQISRGTERRISPLPATAITAVRNWMTGQTGSANSTVLT